MEILIETYQRLLRDYLPSYERQFYRDFTLPQNVVGVIGARGVGKTTFLLDYLHRHYPQSDKGLYVSADHLYFNEHSLLSVVDQFVKESAGELICLDEIHKYANWNQELKNIADSYPNLKVIFSGSSSLDLIQGKFDLSRRVYLKTLYGFTFREYLEIMTKKSFPSYNLTQLLQQKNELSQQLSAIPRLLGYFKDYLLSGYYPSFLKITDPLAYQQSLLNIVDKIIYEDISTFYSIKTGNLDSFKKLVYFIATSQPGSINIHRLSQSLQKDHTTTSGYLQMLRDSGVLRFLLISKTGHALIRNTEKIYLDNPNLLATINQTIGQSVKAGLIRETFALMSLQNAGFIPLYTQTGDFKVNQFTFEIGGTGKDAAQISGVSQALLLKDDTLIATPTSLPLFLLGFLT